MDPITSAILAALAMGVIGGSQEIAKIAMVDAYNVLKGLVIKKLGSESEVAKAIISLESKPTSLGRQETLKEELDAANLEEDKEVVNAAQKLIDLIKNIPDGNKIVNQTVTGNGNVFSGTGNVTITNPRKRNIF